MSGSTVRWVLGAALLALGALPATAGEDYSGQKLVKRSFRGADLAGAKFDGADLTSADFTGARLAGASFREADLTQATFDAADCTGAVFVDAKFSTTMARDTDFSKADLSGCDLSGYSVLKGSKFAGANLRGAKGMTDITGCDFTGADLRGVKLRDAQNWSPERSPTRWKGAVYDDGTRFPAGVDPAAVGAVKAAAEKPAEPATPPDAAPAPAGKTGGGLGGGLGGGGLLKAGGDPPAAPAVGTGRDVSGQDWRGRDLRGEALDDANFEGTILSSARLDEATLRRANLRKADLWGARCYGTDFSGADLREANLKDVHFGQTKLVGANLEGQDLSVLWGLTDTSFRGANLRNLKGGLHVTVTRCDFRKADLRGAHLAGPGTSYFSTCDFRGAVYDRRTRWPKGFDVDGSGAVRAAGDKDDGEGDEEDPPRLLAADKDPDAPPEIVVRKVFRDSIEDLAGSLILRHGQGGKDAPPVPVGVRYSVEMTKLTYLAVEQLRLDGGAEVKSFPVEVEGKLTAEGKDGSERTDPFHWKVHYYRTDTGVWKCSQPEAKRPASR